MKKMITFLCSLFIACSSLPAQTATYIHTSGRYILGPCNDTITLKGINYAPYNWGYDINELKIDEIAQTGANAVRLVWYWSNPGAGVYTNYVALDSAISKCVRHKMIAIVELHDFTCGSNASTLISGSGWWQTGTVFNILNKYKESVIVNIANEALQVQWSSNPATALTAYKNTYQTIISNLRNVTGFHFPLMIDAPDCGQHSDAFITGSTAAGLISYDPDHNLIFSAHAYWYGYAGNDSIQMATKVSNVLAQNIPLVLGEIANQQDDASMCQYNLNYQPLLRYCETRKTGWLSWSWDHDGCPARQISSNGYANSLTTYGNDIVNNPDYGLAVTAVKSKFLLNGGLCEQPAGIAENELLNSITLYPNPSAGMFTIATPAKIKTVQLFDLLGKATTLERTGENEFKANAGPGAYVITVTDIHNHVKKMNLILTK